ncbi:MAG: hypothetical protein L0209_10540 [candidate division Zixibacteria bacterium]|nr:hypothetical protein [candidate division Zixibacteria bacterium]
MKRIPVLTTLTALLALWTTAAWADAPPVINFQGVLRDGSGNPVANGTYGVTFKIYNVPTLGAALFTETQALTTVNGLFTALIGDSTFLGVADLVFEDTARYLGITVAPDAEMTPRQKLSSVPYGYRVNTVDSAYGGTIKGELTVTNKLNVGTGHTNLNGPNLVVGANNSATGGQSSVTGGSGNDASGTNSHIGGGGSNTATATNATVGGGTGNDATAERATVGGGFSNTASVIEATVGGGGSNTASAAGATVGGGSNNNASGARATIGGGIQNEASGTNSTVAGGSANKALTSVGATVGGGVNDTASGLYSTVPGGRANKASGDYSFAAGRRAKAIHAGAFVWGDQTDADFSSTVGDQFLIRASAGVGIGTNNTGGNNALRVVGASIPSGQMVYFNSPTDPGLSADLLAVDAPTTAPAGFQFIECARGADIEFRVDGDGDAFSDGAFTGGGADFAEMVAVSSGALTVEPGDVLVIDPNNHRATVKSTQSRSTLVAGIFSTKPGFVGSERDWDKPLASNRASEADAAEETGSYTREDMAREFNEIPLAVVGIVPCKVSAEGGPIRPGDLLVTSSTAGHAMRDENPKVGTVLGKALGTLSSGTGVIKVLVTLH